MPTGEGLHAALVARAIGALAPRERLSGSVWAERHGWIARGSGASSGGRYSLERAPYLREILDVMCDEKHRDVVFNKPAQIGFTEAVNQFVGYVMDHDPAGCIVIQPDIERAKAWMKERIDPMLSESPALRGVVRSEGGRRTSDDTMQRKVFRGGYLVVVGANSPAGLRSRPARYLVGDERSGWTLDARNQGDPWDLGVERTTTFWNAKRVQGSTPGERGTCPITAQIAESDRRRYVVPCPACGHREPFTWRDPDGTYRIVCDRDPAGGLIPETAAYLCRACGVLIPEYEKPRMTARGVWVPTHPGRDVVGFDLGGGGGLMSPWQSWADVMRKWTRAQRDPEKLKVFVTHVLGDPYYVERERIEIHTLQSRAEPMPEAPSGVAFTVAAVDVQRDRVETLEVGVGASLELWLWRWTQHFGDPQTEPPWDDALALLKTTRSWGVPLLGVAADTGYLPDAVWKALDRWAPRLPGVRLLGTKGIGGPGRQIIAEPAKASRRTVRNPWIIGTDTAKDALVGHGLRVAVPPGGPGAVHLCSDLDPSFYEQLTAESPERVQFGGRTVIAWRKRDTKSANEGLDLAVGALAVAVALVTKWRVNPAALLAARTAPEAPPEAPKVPLANRTSPWLPRRGGWMR